MSTVSVQQGCTQKSFATFQDAIDYIKKEREEGYKGAITITGHEFIPPENEKIDMKFKSTAATVTEDEKT